MFDVVVRHLRKKHPGNGFFNFSAIYCVAALSVMWVFNIARMGGLFLFGWELSEADLALNERSSALRHA